MATEKRLLLVETGARRPTAVGSFPSVAQLFLSSITLSPHTETRSNTSVSFFWWWFHSEIDKNHFKLFFSLLHLAPLVYPLEIEISRRGRVAAMALAATAKNVANDDGVT